MRIAIISASNRQPDWVRTGFDFYARRLRGECQLELRQIPLPKRSTAAALPRLRDKEGQRMLAAVPKAAHIVALDGSGHAWTTTDLAARLSRWLARGAPVAVLIGGPDGLSDECLSRAGERWALSSLTLPHGLVRIVAAEAIYRAFSLLRGHPYHRD